MILGLSAGFHDAGATLVDNEGNILFAGHSERYSGVKNDAELNWDLINDAFSYGTPEQVAWYELPWLKKTRQLYSGEWRKIFSDDSPQYLIDYVYFDERMLTRYHSHHKCHAAAGFQTSPYDNARCIVVDAIGEWDTISVWDASYDDKGKAKYKKLWSQKYPHSIGLYYSAVTQYVDRKSVV